MALKLLTRKDAPIENKELGIRVRFGLVLPEHIAEMQGMFRASSDPAIAIAIYAMRHCVSELTVEGEEIDARATSYQIDPRDAANRAFLYGLAAMVVEELLVSEDARKKSEAPPQPTSAAEDA